MKLLNNTKLVNVTLQVDNNITNEDLYDIICEVLWSDEQNTDILAVPFIDNLKLEDVPTEGHRALLLNK